MIRTAVSLFVVFTLASVTAAQSKNGAATAKWLDGFEARMKKAAEDAVALEARAKRFEAVLKQTGWYLEWYESERWEAHKRLIAENRKFREELKTSDLSELQKAIWKQAMAGAEDLSMKRVFAKPFSGEDLPLAHLNLLRWVATPDEYGGGYINMGVRFFPEEVKEKVRNLWYSTK